MQAQRREVFDGALVREPQADVRRLDLRDRRLPGSRLAHRVLLPRIECAPHRQLGQVVVGGEEVVLQAELPLLAWDQVGRDAQRAVRVRDARARGERAHEAPADEVLVLIARLQARRPHPPRVQVRPPLPRAEPHLEQVGEVALERYLEQDRDGRSRVRVQRQVLMHPVEADKAVDGDRDARLAHVPAGPGDAVGDKVPPRVAKREPHRGDGLRALAVEAELMTGDKARVGGVKAVIPLSSVGYRPLLVGDEKRRAVVDLHGRMRMDRSDQRPPRRHPRLAVGQQTGRDDGARRPVARHSFTRAHAGTRPTLAASTSSTHLKAG